MNVRTVTEPCPFAGCALHAEHDGDHVPRLRLVQRYYATGSLWSRCEVGDSNRCCGRAVALYATADGKGIEVCADCERALVSKGRMVVGGAA